MNPPERCPTCHRAFRKDRSNNQNRYYWGVVIKLLSDHTGFGTDEMHEITKHKFLRQEIMLKTKTGPEEMDITKSTTALDTKAFEEYLSNIRQWASQALNVYIPDPNEPPPED